MTDDQGVARDEAGADHGWLVTPLDDLGAIVRQYDEWASSYDADLAAWRYDAPAVVARTVATWRAAAGTNADGAVLDAGCGTGLVGVALRGLGIADIDGLDVSAPSLAVAAGHDVYRRLVRHDLTIVPYPVAADAYDAAVCVGVLSYVPQTGALLRELCRAVRPGGLVVVTQRDDLWDERGMPAVLDDLERSGHFDSVESTGPMPYMPGHADFGDRIGVRYVTGVVGPV